MNNYQLSQLATLRIKYKNLKNKKDINFKKKYLLDYLSKLGDCFCTDTKKEREKIVDIVILALNNLED
jgi:hypothetical protein